MGWVIECIVCPFCGKTAAIPVVKESCSVVQCQACLSMGPPTLNKEEGNWEDKNAAILMWNFRTEEI
jgi:hypothetical protein